MSNAKMSWPLDDGEWWIELAVPATGSTLGQLQTFVNAALNSNIDDSAPVNVTLRQGVGNDAWQTYLVLRVDRNTPMPAWLAAANAELETHS